MDQNAERLLEPAAAYRNFYSDAFKKKAEELFEELVKQSGIDRESNKKTAEAYRKQKEAESAVAKKLSTRKTLQILLWVLAGVCLCLGIWGCTIPNVLLIVLPFLIAAGSVVLIFVLLRPQIKKLKEELASAEEKTAALLAEANEQMAPLLALFDSSMTNELIQKTVPKLTIDTRFEMRRYDYMNGKYGLRESLDENASLLGLLSGEILGNPFLVEKHRIHRMGTETYTGHLTISWTETYRDSDGKVRTRVRTQVLTAHVTKPKPFYSEETRLVYGNDAAPDLSFSHEKTHAEKMSEKKRASFVKSESKKIHKQAEKDAAFTEMANEEFDAIFNGTERDHEVQFRLLFTPLAQKNLLDIMTGGSPFGDDFDFVKRKCLNYIISEHSQSWNPDTDTSRYASYDLELCKKAFVDFNHAYFTGFYFDMAPLLAIPLYQQNMPREYIYQKSYPRNYTTREAELLSNKLGERYFAHPRSATPCILKTRLSRKHGEVDELTVEAHSYRTVNRLDYVPTMGGDGRMHSVPVPWVEYLPISKVTDFSVEDLDGMSEPEFRKKNTSAVPHVYYHRLFASLGKEGFATIVPDNEENAK
ncbi:MAG: hypothetical protein IJR88_02050 [Clostridia bacterium]|nr:hypothetical protein [Clostridia bacterium]